MAKLNSRAPRKTRVTIDLDEHGAVIAVAKKRLPPRSAPKQLQIATSRTDVPGYMRGTGFTHGAPDDDY